MPGVAKYDASKGLGALDKILLRGASSHKSPNELSALTNGVIKPAQAAARVLEILDSRDWLTQAQKRALLIDDLMALKDSLYEKAVKFGSLDAAKPLVTVLTQIDKTLAADKLDVAAALTQINRAQGHMMLEGIEAAFGLAMDELAKRYPQVDRSELSEVLVAALPEAVKAVEARVVE